EHRRAVLLKLNSDWMREVSNLARNHRMVVIPNVLLEEKGRCYNSAVVYGPEGEVIGQYRKTHTAPGECNYFDAGDALEPITTPFGKIGLLICYDINFP